MIRILLVLAALLAAPAAAQETEGAAPAGPIAAEEDAGSDAAIERRLTGILSELDGFDGVQVSVSEGVVTFTGETVDGVALERLDEIGGRVEGVVAVENEATASADVSERLDPAIARIRDRTAQAIAFLPLLGIALAVFLLIAGLGWLVSRARWPWDRLAPNAFVASIYRQLAWIAFVILGAVVALDILNAVALLGTILGAAGIVGLAIGFAVRDTVENFIASVMLSFRQPFNPGDVVEIEGDRGKIVRLTSRATVLLDFDGNQILIPNATVFKSRLVNFTRNDERRFQFEIGVAPDADLEGIRTLIRETLGAAPFVLEQPAPLVWIDRIGDGAIFLQVTGWIDQRESNIVVARGEALRLSKAAVEGAGVEVPDTTYRVTLLPGGGGLSVTEAAEDAPAPAPSDGLDEARIEAARRAGARVADVSDAGTDAALDRIVHAERAQAADRDLLDANARRE